MPTLSFATTALVLIDLQQGILNYPLEPRSAADVVEAGIDLATRFRVHRAPVVLVHVDFAPDFADALNQPVDQPRSRPPGGFPPGFSDIAEGLAQPGDIHITKRQWGAFHGTELDLQLRRRGIKTIVLGGVATNMGVESTARAAYEHGYEVIIAEDATAGASAEMHAFAVTKIFPLLSRVVQVADIALA